MHALVFWGFILILFGSAEMLTDGFIGSPFDHDLSNDRTFSVLGIVYNIIIAGGDISAWIILILIMIFQQNGTTILIVRIAEIRQ